MASSGQLRAVERVAEAYDAKLRADDPRFRRCVWIDHGDGSKLFFRYAFALRHDTYWLVFTEHHEWWVYDSEDADVTQYAETRIEELPKEQTL